MSALPSLVEGSSDLRLAALDAAGRGWPVIPLYGLIEQDDGTWVCECNLGPKCHSPGKHPRIFRWRTHATTNPAVISAWWAKWPHSNLGIPTGREFGLVLDFDPRNGSDASLAKMEAIHGELPHTLATRSGGGGEHLIFAYPEEYGTIRSLSALDWCDGIDVQVEGKLVVAPPSRHKSGNRYEWATDISAPMLALPGWMLLGLEEDLLAGPAPDYADAWSWAALRAECRKVESAKEGTRHKTLYAAACRVGEVVAGGSLARPQAITHLMRAAESCGLSEEEARFAIADGLKVGAKNPRHPNQKFGSREDALTFLDTVRSIFASVPRNGHRGTRMRTCMEAMILIARDHGGPSNFNATIRQVAIRAGAGDSSMGVALAELCDEGWLYRKRKGFQGVPSRWDIRIPTKYKHLYQAPTHEEASEGVWGSRGQVIHDLPVSTSSLTTRQSHIGIGHDAFLSSLTTMTDVGLISKSFGFGKSAWIIWDHLASWGGWHSQTAIAESTGYDRTTVSEVVNQKLVPFDLVEKGPDGVKALFPTDDELDDIARAFSTYDGHELRVKAYRSRRPS